MNNEKFIKSYFKKALEKEGELDCKEFDVNKRQAPLKTFKEVNKEKYTNYKYSYNKHRRRVYDFLSKERATALMGVIEDINAFVYERS